MWKSNVLNCLHHGAVSPATLNCMPGHDANQFVIHDYANHLNDSSKGLQIRDIEQPQAQSSMYYNDQA